MSVCTQTFKKLEGPLPTTVALQSVIISRFDHKALHSVQSIF